MLDVSGWHADLRWEPRGDSVENIVRATSQTRLRFVSVLGEFDGSWNAAGAAGTIEFPSPNISEFVSASVVRTGGAPDPTRGFSSSASGPPRISAWHSVDPPVPMVNEPDAPGVRRAFPGLAAWLPGALYPSWELDYADAVEALDDASISIRSGISG